MQRNFLLLIGIFFLLEFYAYQAFRNLVSNSWLRVLYWVITILLYGFLIFKILYFQRTDKDPHSVQMIATLFLSFILPKILVSFFLLTDDVIRVFSFTIQKFSGHSGYFPERRKFLSVVGLAFGGLLSAFVLDGVIFGKYRHQVRTVKLRLKNLPQSFRGYKILQISDVHSGSFFHPEKLEHAISLINQQKPDLVVFTGDMVNNVAGEFLPFVSLFSKIKAQDGKFSILGNHDYGDYAQWASIKEKAQNLQQLIDYQKQAGFSMLRNENRAIEKNGEKLYLVGVENWGEKPFPQFGDLNKALEGVPEQACTILLSHDPTHFDSVVKNHPHPIQLTLSGHTHGMQFGLDLKNIKWSPVQYKYPKWADLYESNGKYLYVNRGFGVIGYPGRVGVAPEITVFVLE